MAARDGDHVHPATSEHLTEPECWELLAAASLARLALLRPDGAPDILPVNHLVHDGAIYLRTAADAKLTSIAAEPRVAVEVDGEDADSRWSVVARGSAAQLTSEAEIHRAGIADLVSWAPTTKHFVIRIAPERVTGRRFAKTTPTTDPVYAVPVTEAARASHAKARGERPSPIPHYSPPPRS